MLDGWRHAHTAAAAARFAFVVLSTHSFKGSTWILLLVRFCTTKRGSRATAVVRWKNPGKCRIWRPRQQPLAMTSPVATPSTLFADRGNGSHHDLP
eukprot:scaffold8593_cov248-Pinguiococcus_pyrenoidosus.AAC.7